MRRTQRWLVLALLATAVVATATPAHADRQGACVVQSFRTPVREVFGLAAGPDGNVWFHGVNDQERARIGFITPSGATTVFRPGPGVFVRDLTAGPDGAVWFTDGGVGRIGRITTAGAVTWFDDPLVGRQLDAIITGPDGNLWFLRHNPGRLFRMTTAGEVTAFDGPVIKDPSSLTVGGGALWWGDSLNYRIGRLSMAGVPREVARLTASMQGTTYGPDGNVWFTLRYRGRVGRVTPSGQVALYGDNRVLQQPVDMSRGPRGALWFVTQFNNRVGRVDVDGRVTTFTGLNGKVRDASNLVQGPDGRLWISGVGSRLARVGRCSVPG